MCHQIQIIRRPHHHFFAIHVKMHYLSLISLDKPKFREGLQNTWSVMFENIKNMKVKERLKNCSKLRRRGKTWPLDAMQDPTDGSLCYIGNV